MAERHYTVILLPYAAGGYTVTVPLLPGITTEGDSPAEALENARDAIMLYTDHMRACGEAVPEEPMPAAVLERALGEARDIAHEVKVEDGVEILEPEIATVTVAAVTAAA